MIKSGEEKFRRFYIIITGNNLSSISDYGSISTNSNGVILMKLAIFDFDGTLFPSSI